MIMLHKNSLWRLLTLFVLVSVVTPYTSDEDAHKDGPMSYDDLLEDQAHLELQKIIAGIDADDTDYSSTLELDKVDRHQRQIRFKGSYEDLPIGLPRHKSDDGNIYTNEHFSYFIQVDAEEDTLIDMYRDLPKGSLTYFPPEVIPLELLYSKEDEANNNFELFTFHNEEESKEIMNKTQESDFTASAKIVNLSSFYIPEDSNENIRNVINKQTSTEAPVFLTANIPIIPNHSSYSYLHSVKNFKDINNIDSTTTPNNFLTQFPNFDFSKDSIQFISNQVYPILEKGDDPISVVSKSIFPIGMQHNNNSFIVNKKFDFPESSLKGHVTSQKSTKNSDQSDIPTSNALEKSSELLIYNKDSDTFYEISTSQPKNYSIKSNSFPNLPSSIFVTPTLLNPTLDDTGPSFKSISSQLLHENIPNPPLNSFQPLKPRELNSTKRFSISSGMKITPSSHSKINISDKMSSIRTPLPPLRLSYVVKPENSKMLKFGRHKIQSNSNTRTSKKLKDVEYSSIPGARGTDYSSFDIVPKSNFDCSTKSFGQYYADPETNCQVFHVCLGRSKKATFHCPSDTLFNQKLLVCDWWYKVKCSSSPNNPNSSAKFLIKQL